MTTTSATTLTRVAIGDHAPGRTVGPITRSDLVRYAGAGGDFNPIHHDELFARRAGLETVFAMGMFHAGLLSQLVAGWFGVTNVRRFGVRFTGQVWPGDVLSLDGTVDELREQNGIRLAECTLTVSRQTGDVVIAGSATAVVA